jgi:type II secretory pathway pseudopilin PulG
MSLRRGVTLAEVVVMLMVVGILATLIAGVSGRVRIAAQRLGCQANLGCIGAAFLAYGVDHRRVFPADSDFGLSRSVSPAWFDRLPDYLDERKTRDGSVFQCPAWRMPVRRFVTSQPRSLKMNSYLDDDGRPRHFRLGSVSDQDDLLLMVDAVAGETGMGQWGRAVYSGVDDRRHRGLVVSLAVDGHTVARTARPPDGDWRLALRWRSRDWPVP